MLQFLIILSLLNQSSSKPSVLDDSSLRVDMEQAMKEELAGIPNTYISNNLENLRSDAEMLIFAYKLETAVLPVFWREMFRLLAEQYKLDVDTWGKPVDPNMTEEATMRFLTAYNDKRPTRPENLMAKVENMLGKNDYTIPRRHFKELNYRRQQKVVLGDDEKVRNIIFQGNLVEGRMARTALVGAAGKPGPRSVLVAQEIALKKKQKQEAKARELAEGPIQSIIYPTRGVFRRGNESDRPSNDNAAPSGKASPSVLTTDTHPDAAAASPSDQPVLPREEDPLWQQCSQLAEEYEGKLQDPSKVECVKAIATDLWTRANAYRNTRRKEYESIESLTSVNAYREALARLEQPMQALLVEFQQRLEALVSPSGNNG